MARSTTQQAVGAVIRGLRERRGWTVTELARRSRASKQLVSAIERGDRAPSLSTCGRLAKAFGVTLADIFPSGDSSQHPE